MSMTKSSKKDDGGSTKSGKATKAPKRPSTKSGKSEDPGHDTCGDGSVPVVTISDGTTSREPIVGEFHGNFYNFNNTLDHINCQGKVDFKRIFDKGSDGGGHPFRLCVGGIVDSSGSAKCESKFVEDCGIECVEYQVGEDLAEDGDCASIDISSRQLWYVCTVDQHEMYNRLC